MKRTKTYNGTGSVLSGDDWHACEYQLNLLESPAQQAIEGTVQTNDSAAANILMSGSPTTTLRLSTGKEVKVHVKTSNIGEPLNVHVNGPID